MRTMSIRQMRIGCRRLALATFVAIVAGLIALPRPAQARVWIGFGFPLYVGPPAYYPPPVYYPSPPYYPPPYYPPPAYASPAPPQYTPSGQSCIAGPAVCPMEHPVATGSACYCTTPQGRVWGRAT